MSKACHGEGGCYGEGQCPDCNPVIDKTITQIIQLIETAYPEGGTYQDVDTTTLPDGTTQYLFYFSRGGRAAYQTGWDSINLERFDDLPFLGATR